MKARAQAMAQESQPSAIDEGAEMLARHIAGDPRAFGQLVERYKGTVYGYLVRCGVGNEVTDDLFQETFMRVHLAARRYNPEYPFRVWLFTIANNLIRSHFRKLKVRRIFVSLFRKRNRHDPHAGSVALDPPDESPDAERLAEARKRARWLSGALEDLADGPRRALLLTQVEGLSQQEAAQTLGVPVPTVKTWIRRGRLALATALEHAAGEKEADHELP